MNFTFGGKSSFMNYCEIFPNSDARVEFGQKNYVLIWLTICSASQPAASQGSWTSNQLTVQLFIQSFACETWEHGAVNLKLNLELFTELLDTETDHLGSGDLCGRLVQAAKLVQEDVRVEIATRDAAQVIETN